MARNNSDMRRHNRTEIASWAPFGVGHAKPHHYWEMLHALWENRDNLPFAWRILTRGVCDGCSLGPRGLRDDTMDGIHLCMVRLKMLRLNTMPALDPARLADAAKLRKLNGKQLREMGRLPYPLLRRRGEAGFQRITWDEAFALLGERMRAIAARDPDRMAFYTTSRGLTNEVYYVAQKVARLLGTNNIDNAARLCHAASTSALKSTIGVGASTCSYTDWIGTDLIVLLGSDIANNQPVATKYFYLAKQRGARIVVVNPYKEPGLERYWVPSVAKSALFGTRLADEFFQVRVGGDVAFLNGVLKWLIHLSEREPERHRLDAKFIAEHTTGFEELKAAVEAQSWEALEEASGAIRDQMLRFAEMYAAAKNAVFIWSMGLTQHRFGVQNVQAVVNLALARGMIGRSNAGLVPVRGHSGVQGGAECGSVPNTFPGGAPVNEENARRFGEMWGHPLSASAGLSAPEMLEAADRGELDLFYIAGGNFVETMPEPERMRAALERVPCRVHQDLFVNSSMLAEPGEFVLLLPGQTRYEQKGGGTLTSTERRIRFSPEIPGPRIGEAMAEWEIFARAGQAALGAEKKHLLEYTDTAAIRAEMERVMPLYRGIAGLRAEGESVQYGGPLLCANGVCANMPGGRARFTALAPPRLDDVAATFRSPSLAADAASEVAGDRDHFDRKDGDLKVAATSTARAGQPNGARFYLATRRGKQFNTMVWDEADALAGTTRRDAIFIAPEDAQRLGLRQGDAVVVFSTDRAEMASNATLADRGAREFRGTCHLAPVKPGTLQAYWPECNVLLTNRLDPISKEPDYNAWVMLHKV
ncbi:MAG: molybdopterin-dependent oxidoreductase [Candidatus Acidiferrales bacterium]